MTPPGNKESFKDKFKKKRQRNPLKIQFFEAPPPKRIYFNTKNYFYSTKHIR